MPPPLPRGGLGIPQSFISSPEAPLPGELSSDSETERLVHFLIFRTSHDLGDLLRDGGLTGAVVIQIQMLYHLAGILGGGIHGGAAGGQLTGHALAHAP